MKVCKCDRCGIIFEPHHANNDFYNRIIQVGEETFGLTDIEGIIDMTYDICDGCYESFKKWMRRGTIEKK